MSKFGPVVPPGPALALTKTHVALQQKGTELAFLQDTFTRAQSSWVKEKNEMVWTALYTAITTTACIGHLSSDES
jgi:hypothetical protein